MDDSSKFTNAKEILENSLKWEMLSCLISCFTSTLVLICNYLRIYLGYNKILLGLYCLISGNWPGSYSDPHRQVSNREGCPGLIILLVDMYLDNSSSIVSDSLEDTIENSQPNIVFLDEALLNTM